ncbi:unnamed protein product [Linum tenue]|uniref:Uncharacterized protein n=1 Tax=Linum tenue TaxID=586396 RepID=A0AAV0H5E7_9ROSI|nr:unnamed protein product [Linum tenue]
MTAVDAGDDGDEEPPALFLTVPNSVQQLLLSIASLLPPVTRRRRRASDQQPAPIPVAAPAAQQQSPPLHLLSIAAHSSSPAPATSRPIPGQKSSSPIIPHRRRSSLIVANAFISPRNQPRADGGSASPSRLATFARANSCVVASSWPCEQTPL